MTLQAVYGGNNRLRGTIQGNMLLASIYLSQSCVTFKFLEGMHQGIVLQGPIRNDNLKTFALAHVDDEDAFSEGQHALENMQNFIMQLVKLFSATGVLTSIEKTKYFLTA